MTPSPQDDPKTLVSTDWLAKHLRDPDLRVLDASWYLPGAGRDAKAEYDAAHIPGARFFDIDEISDQRSNLPHMAPPPEKFISRMRAMGIGRRASGGGLRRRGHLFSGAGLVDLPADGQDRCGGAGRRLSQVAGRRPRDRGHAPDVRDRHMTVSRQNQLVKDVTQVAHAAKAGRGGDPRCPLAPRFAARRRSRARACGRGIFRGRRTCPSRTF
jgi:thiosulfate/3-mercaptopyruvate sulfurtransferase